MGTLKRNRRPEVNTLWLLAWTAIVVTATLFPFNLDGKGHGSKALELSAPGLVDLLDIVLNTLLFVPLGVLLAQRPRPRASELWLTRLAVGAGAFAFSFTMEYLQQLLPSRDPSLVDVLTNTAGAVLGFHLYGAWGRRITVHLREFRRGDSKVLRVGVLFGFAAFALLASGALQYGARLSNWDYDFPLLIGNEATGDRPWEGRILRFDLSDVSTPEELVRDFATGDSDRLPGGNIAAVDFTASIWSGEGTPNLPPLVWTGNEHVSTSAGVKVDQQAWLHSAQPPKEIARRILASNEFTLRVACASDNADQRGPARILSYSIDPMRRNFTLGQEGPDMVLRLRTPNTGLNGTRIPLVFPGVFLGHELRDVLVTYSGATLRVAIARTNEIHHLDFSPGVSLASFFLDLQPRHFAYIKLVYYGFVFLLQFGPLAWFAHNASRHFAIGLPWLLTFAVVLEATLALASQRRFDLANLGMSLGAGCAILLALGAVLRNSAIQCRRDVREQIV